MTLLRRALAALGTLALAACAHPREAPIAASPTPSGPALWKVADEDTTIYLFGTVHALPKDIEWFRGPVAEALTASQVLVTEIPPADLKKPEVQQAYLAAATLPEGQTLRALLSPEQRAKLETALAAQGLPAASFDRYEPWFAAITLASLPILRAGYSLEAGVENAIEGKAGAPTARASLETVEDQLRLFDEMPIAVQATYLASVADAVDEVVPGMDAMVTAWAKGDAEGLAALMNAELDDPALADRLLYARNRDWAKWVAKRLDEPGTVFVAVGAGHLAGANSVQAYLAKGGASVTRVQ